MKGGFIETVHFAKTGVQSFPENSLCHFTKAIYNILLRSEKIARTKAA